MEVVAGAAIMPVMMRRWQSRQPHAHMLSRQPHCTTPQPHSSHNHTRITLQEATEALKPILGDYYSSDGRNVLAALWQELTLCHYVAPAEGASASPGVLWFNTHVAGGGAGAIVSATAAAAAGFNPAKAAKAA